MVFRSGTGERTEVLRGRPDALVKLYGAIESYVQSLGSVEFVTRDRYVLLRTRRLFADLVIMTDALRVAIHLARRVDDPIFTKIVSCAGSGSGTAGVQYLLRVLIVRRSR